MADVSEVSNGKKSTSRNVQNFYIAQDGSRSARPQPDVVAVGKKFLESGEEIVRNLADFPEAQMRQCAAFGLQQVGQNAYGTAGDEEERKQMLTDRWDTILDGQWSEGRQDGPRVADVLAALVAAMKDRGNEVTEDWVAEKKAAFEAGDLDPKEVAKRPAIKAKLIQIRAERALERAGKMATPQSDLDDLM